MIQYHPTMDGDRPMIKSFRMDVANEGEGPPMGVVQLGKILVKSVIIINDFYFPKYNRFSQFKIDRVNRNRAFV